MENGEFILHHLKKKFFWTCDHSVSNCHAEPCPGITSEEVSFLQLGRWLYLQQEVARVTHQKDDGPDVVRNSMQMWDSDEFYIKGGQELSTTRAARKTPLRVYLHKMSRSEPGTGVWFIEGLCAFPKCSLWSRVLKLTKWKKGIPTIPKSILLVTKRADALFRFCQRWSWNSCTQHRTDGVAFADWLE